MAEDVPAAPRVRGATMIKNLSPALPEKGKVKIGVKGESRQSKSGTAFQPPVRLDHFVVTTLERGTDGNFMMDKAIHEKLGPAPKSIPVRLLYDDPTLNFPTRYAAYKGRTLWCSGDGETADRVNATGTARESVQCPCGRQAPEYKGDDRCKMNGALSMLIDGVSGLGGVHKFRTTSYNSIVGLLSTMAFLKSVTGGPLANIPLNLTVSPKQATAPDGKQMTVYVVGLEFSGDIADAQRIGHQIALDRAQTHLSIERIEDEARRLLAAPIDVPLAGDDNDDIVDEFYPEQAAPPPPRPTREQFVEHVEAELVVDEEPTVTEPAPLPRAFAELWECDVYAIGVYLKDGEKDWKRWCAELSEALKDAETRDEILKLQDDNEKFLNELNQTNVKWFQALMKRFAARLGEMK